MDSTLFDVWKICKQNFVSAKEGAGPSPVVDKEGAVPLVKKPEIKEKDDTPVNPDAPIPLTVFEKYPEQYKPKTVSQVLQHFLTVPADPLIRVMEGLKDAGVDCSKFLSATMRMIADIEYLLSQIPEDRRADMMDYWNANYSRFPGFDDFRVLDEWLKTRGERFMLFLLEQAVKIGEEKKTPDSRTV